MMYWLGIDVGSTACKIVVINKDNEIVKRIRKNIETTPLRVVYDAIKEIEEYVDNDNVMDKARFVCNSI